MSFAAAVDDTIKDLEGLQRHVLFYHDGFKGNNKGLTSVQIAIQSLSDMIVGIVSDWGFTPLRIAATRHEVAKRSEEIRS